MQRRARPQSSGEPTSGEPTPGEGASGAAGLGLGSELGVVRELLALQEAAGGVRAGECWVGDDAAVLEVPSPLLLAADAVVEGVHFDLSLSSLADVGWKAVVVNLSDLAAMGGVPERMVATVAAPREVRLGGLFSGIAEAARTYGCPLVGGDLSSAPVVMVSVSVLGSLPDGPAIGRDGGRPGDELAVTGPLGKSAAGLRLLRSSRRATPAGPEGEGLLDFPALSALGAAEQAAIAAHRRPRPRLDASRAVRRAGARAMIDLSDGLLLDAERLASASRARAVLDRVPVAPSATISEALSGGEDYELLVAVPSFAALASAFAAAGLEAPVRVGRLEAGAGLGVEGELGSVIGECSPGGFEHDLRW